MGVKIESFIKWAHRWEFIITILLGVLIGSVLTVIIGFIPVSFRISAIVLFLAIISLLAFAIICANIYYKYREIQISRNFYSPFTVQKWEEKVTLIDKKGSAKGEVSKVLAVEEGEEIPSIKLEYWSDSLGNDIKHVSTKVNGREIVVNPENLKYLETKEKSQLYKNLHVKIPISDRFSPSIELTSVIEYPQGAYKKALDNIVDSFDLRVYHPTRLIKISFELADDLAKEYRFDNPSFAVLDLDGNRVGSVEEIIKRENGGPKTTSGKLSWNIKNPKVGLAYRLKFRAFEPVS